PGAWYRGMNVFAGKFRADSPADVYAFNSWDQPMQKAAFLLFQDAPAEKIVPSRRRAAGGPGSSAATAAVGAFTLHIVRGYNDLIPGGCCGLGDTFEIQRDVIFVAGTAKCGLRTHAI